YKVNANAKRSDALVYRISNKVMLNIYTVLAIGRCLIYRTIRLEGPFEVTKALLYVVTLKLLANITIFPTFYVSRVRCYLG
ncbi:hypothetical protein BT67DRAFT_386088, partial [Trichocladium antarcticum]